MNKVLLTGKIIKIKSFNTITFITLYCRNGKVKEYIDVTVFNTEFLHRYFCENMWCTIEGHIHKNKTPNGEYKQEIIADTIGFAGDAHDVMYDGKTQDEAAASTFEDVSNSEALELFEP